MKISAIIAEYNPIHNGHIYHINETKKALNSDGIICVMSGNFVQRGEPSIIDKWIRTETALHNGIDLVLELPTVYAVSSAEFFGFGAVSLLNSLNVVSNLSFGSELGDLKSIYNIANILTKETTDYKKSLKSYIDLGLPYYTARSYALGEILDENHCGNISEILSNSNNILAIEYCKSLIKIDSSIEPFTIKRNGDNYNDLQIKSKLPSATAIRKHIKDKGSLSLKDFMPPYATDKLSYLIKNGYDFTFKEAIFRYIKYKCLTLENNIEKIPDASEGLNNKIYNSILSSNCFEELMDKAKSKRYSYTRISRILCQYFIGFENYNTNLLRSVPCPYARVLGFNETGRRILRLIKNNSDIPFYTKLPCINAANECLKLDIQATNAYSILNKNIKPMSDYTTSPIFTKI
jgi:predicted nucleotidyltransferase